MGNEPRHEDESILEFVRRRSEGALPGHLSMEFQTADYGSVTSRMVIGPHHMAPNGYLHAASVVALADTSCGYGVLASLPEGAIGFTTIELKSNHLGTARIGDAVVCAAKLAHGGRTTQVWDATVVNDVQGATIALFRCTQLLLYPPRA